MARSNLDAAFKEMSLLVQHLSNEEGDDHVKKDPQIAVSELV